LIPDIDPAPACIPTLMRDTDVRLGVQEALGALFRAGVALDFAAQYPRPEPIAHLLRGHPREDRATMDIMCDNGMFVRQGEYSHGPLIGHKVPCAHMLFEARLSDRDFVHLFERAVNADASGWPAPAIVVNGMAGNSGMAWSLEETRRYLGYQPVDDVTRIE